MPDPVTTLGARGWPSAPVGDRPGGIQVPLGRPGAGPGAPTFEGTLRQFVNGVSEAQDASAALRDRFLRGEPVELHQVMAAGEESSLALELMVELRNKVADAYRQLINIQS